MLEWDEQLRTGDEAIDKQHKALINAINTLHQAAVENHGRLALTKVVRFIEAYATEHFFMEERLAMQNDYPESRMLLHRAQHDSFRVGIQKTLTRYKLAHHDPQILIELSQQMTKWFGEHVTRLDLDLAKWVQEKNRTNSAG